MTDLLPNGWAVIPKYGDERLGTLPVIAGSKNILNGDVLTLFTRFLLDYAKTVEPIDRSDSWGFSPRKITGDTKVWSRHAGGIAVDINSTKYPMYRNYMSSMLQAKIRALLQKYRTKSGKPVIRWGGNYPEASLDQMHYEVDVTAKELAEFLAQTKEEESGMYSPAVGYVSSPYGYRSGVKHAGLDIATNRKPGAVYAAYDGTIAQIVRGRKHGQSASTGPVLAKGRSGNGLRVKNPDGEQQLYGHVDVLATLAVGNKVKKGQLLGYTDLSGITTGYHLHFEVWNKNGVTRDPMIDFNYHGVKPGAVGTTPTPPTPAPTPAPTPTPPSKDAAVEAYQKRQNKYANAGLYVDGDNGAKTKAWRQWAKEAQDALNKFKAVSPKLLTDGDYGATTHNAVRKLQQKNGLYVDGVLGAKTINWMRSKGSSLRQRP